MKPTITFRQNPPCPNLSPNQFPKFPISTFFGAIAVENKVGLVVQFGINRLPFGGESGFCCSFIGGDGGFCCSFIGEEGGFCCSVIGDYLIESLNPPLQIIPKPAPIIVPKPAPIIVPKPAPTIVPKPAPTSNFSAPNAFANKLRKFIFFVQSPMFYE